MRENYTFEPEDNELVEKLHEAPITLIELEGDKEFEAIKAKAPGQDIVLADARMKGVEEWERKGPAFVRENVTVVDHHMNLPEMSRNISTTNLAIDYVRQFGPVPKETVVMISHTDCDSILSSLILRGIIKPEDKYGEAAIAADHTGVPNEIGDLVQSLEKDDHNEDARDVELSVRNLELFLKGEPLEPEAQSQLEGRLAEREKIAEMVKGFKHTDSGYIYYAKLDKNIDGGLVPGVLPEAHIIVMFVPKPGNDSLQIAKGRLGNSAPAGTDLRFLLKNIDENFKGRWDAGSNARSGGTSIPMEKYISDLDATYLEYLDSRDE